MSTEIIYKISYMTNQKKYYQLNGPNGELFYFYNKKWEKSRLITQNGKDYITTQMKSLFSTSINIIHLNPSNFSNTKFSLDIQKYKLTGNYLKVKGHINWEWKRSSNWSASLILIDKNFVNQIMAKIKGFTIKRQKEGTLIIMKDVPQDYFDTILISACIIWKREQDSNEDEDKRAIINN